MFLFSMGKISSFFQLFLSNETARDGGEQIHTHTHTHIIVKFTRLERRNSRREIRVNSLSVSLRLSFFRNRLLQEAFNNNQQTSFFPKSGGRLFIRYKKFVKCINTHARTQTDNMSETRKEQDDDDMERVAAFGSSGSQRDGKPDEV